MIGFILLGYWVLGVVIAYVAYRFSRGEINVAAVVFFWPVILAWSLLVSLPEICFEKFEEKRKKRFDRVWVEESEEDDNGKV